jgi:hypothetical protein
VIRLSNLRTFRGWWAFALFAAVGCGANSGAPRPVSGSAPAGNAQLKPTYDQTGKLTRLEYDRDHDGKMDTWGYMDGSRVVRVETDENGDGTIDRWEFHSQAGQAGRAGLAGQAGSDVVDPTLERIEEATHFDGHVNRWLYFTDGRLTRTEEDLNGDGKVDQWETYRDGSLATVDMDETGRGTPTRRMVYGADGSLDHIEVDPSGSGHFQPLAK